MGGSQQWRLLRRAIRNGHTEHEAATIAGIDISEARSLIQLDRDTPPSAADYELLYPLDPRAAGSSDKETQMAKPDEGAEYQRPDADKAFDIFEKQISPKLAIIDTKRGECSQPWSHIKEHANFPRPVMNFLLALQRIDDEAKQQHFLLALSEGLSTLGLTLEADLFSEGERSLVPTAKAKDVELFGDDDNDDDDHDGNDGDVPQSAAPADPFPEVEPAAGTGAAARKAMSAKNVDDKPAPRSRRAARPKDSPSLSVVH